MRHQINEFNGSALWRITNGNFSAILPLQDSQHNSPKFEARLLAQLLWSTRLYLLCQQPYLVKLFLKFVELLETFCFNLSLPLKTNNLKSEV